MFFGGGLVGWVWVWSGPIWPAIHGRPAQYGRPYRAGHIWPYMAGHIWYWKKLVGRFGVGNPLANRIVASIGSVIDDKQEKDVRKFFKRMPLPGTERVIEQTLERVRIRSKFLRSIRAEFV